MLISRRIKGDTLMIGEVEIRVLDVVGKSVTLGILAPRALRITHGGRTPKAQPSVPAAPVVPDSGPA